MKNSISFNVLHICDYSAPYRGNFIDSIASIEKYHPSVKNFYLFPARAQNTAAMDWIAALNKNEKIAYIQRENVLCNLFLLNSIIKKHKIDRIVRHFSDKKIDVLIKLLFDGKKVIRFFHSGCKQPNNVIVHKLKKIIFKNNTLVGVSEAVANDLRTIFPGFRVHSIVNAIHFYRLEHVGEFEKRQGVALLMMGWDSYRKGVDLAIQAVYSLRKQYNVVLQIVCGNAGDDIKKFAQELYNEDTDWIRCLPQTNNIGTYYKASDIFLSPSRQEAFGYANVEAAYCKNSIVLSKVDGQGELIIEGAYWCEPNNIEDLAKKLELAISERDLPEKINQREEAKRQIEQTYSLKEWSNKLVSLF